MHQEDKTGKRGECAVAVQINLIPKDHGLMVVPFSQYNIESRTAEEIGGFVIPWHEVQGVIERMWEIECMHIESTAGICPLSK